MNAQQRIFDSKFFTTQNGLTDNNVQTLLEDSRGFIWAGTRYGLNRFDGHEFQKFSSEENGLSSGISTLLLEDVHGNIWNVKGGYFIAGNIHVDIFDVWKEQARPFQKIFPDAPFRVEEVGRLIPGEERIIWISTKDGRLFRYDGDFKLVFENSSKEVIRSLKFLGDDEIWMCSHKELICLNKNWKEHWRTPTPYLVRTFELDDQGRIWFTVTAQKEKGLFFYFQPHTNGKEGGRFHFLEKNDFSELVKNLNFSEFDFQKNTSPKAWLLGTNKLICYDLKSESAEHFDVAKLTRSPRVAQHDMIKDKTGNYWIATARGLLLLYPHRQLFHKFLETGDFSSRGILDWNEHEFLIATYKGFYKVDKNNGTHRMFPYLNAKAGDNYGLGILKYDKGIFLGKHTSKVYLLDTITHRAEKYDFAGKQGNNGNAGFFFHKDKKEQVWICTKLGLYKIFEEEKVAKIPQPHLAELPLYFKQSNFIFENEEGLWIATNNGIYFIDYEGNILQTWKSLQKYPIQHIHQDTDGIFWLSTKGNGLIRWDREQDALRRFTKKDGFSNDYIYAAVEDNLGYLWLPSNEGLMRFNRHDFSINIFFKQDGLTHNEFNYLSNLKDRKGRIILGGLQGGVIIQPKDFEILNKKNTPLVLTNYSELKKGKINFENKTKSILDLSEIEIAHDVSAISLGFSLLDYENAFQSKYAYQIVGYDEEWTFLSDNQLKINALPSGLYTLRIKGQGRYGQWSELELALKLKVMPPLFLDWRFLIPMTILLGGIIYGIVRWRTFWLEKDKILLEKEVALRTEELANMNKIKDEFFAILAHDLRAPVVSFQNISKKIQFLQKKGSAEDVENMFELVDQAASSLNNLLDNLLNWALLQKGVFPYNPTLVNIKTISEQTLQLYEPYAEGKGIRLEQNIPHEINAKVDKEALYAVLRNLISNAIKYSSQNDTITISASNGAGVFISVKDTGVGIAPDQIKNLFQLGKTKTSFGTEGEKGTGLGLVLCKQLVELNEGSIQVKSKVGEGTEFVIELSTPST